jgi:hypothetical protein
VFLPVAKPQRKNDGARLQRDEDMMKTVDASMPTTKSVKDLTLFVVDVTAQPPGYYCHTRKY